jgi:amino acid adenylation domain-containing protein
VFFYTSGTTGVPKAIVLSHNNVTAFTQWAITHLGLTPTDRFASHAPLHFDLTTLDLYAAVRLGATTVLLDEVAVRFPAKIAQIIEAAGVSVWYSVPTALTLLYDHGALDRRDLGSLRLVLFAGEPFPVPSLRRLMETLPGREFINLYGPTETNVCTYHRLPGPPAADALDVPIGIPCEHLQVEIMRDDGTPAPPGETGEIWVRGPAVMQGYWGNPGLTASVRHGSDPTSYRTGDYGCRAPDGCIRLVGRRDDQVKVRGHRVELLEIAAILTRHPAVREAAALITAAAPQRLAAAVALHPGTTTNSKELQSHCHRWLPHYATPEEIRILLNLPRTSTGKLDKQSLTQTLSHTTER